MLAFVRTKSGTCIMDTWSGCDCVSLLGDSSTTKSGYRSFVFFSQPNLISFQLTAELSAGGRRERTRTKGTFKLGCASTKLKVLRLLLSRSSATHSSSGCQALLLGSASTGMCAFWAPFACLLACLFFESGFLCIALAILELAL